jgi:hypothetical protein
VSAPRRLRRESNACFTSTDSCSTRAQAQASIPGGPSRPAIDSRPTAGRSPRRRGPAASPRSTIPISTTPARENGLRLFEVANGSFDAGNAGDATHPSTEALWDRVLTAGGWLYGTATDDAHHYFDASQVRARGQPVYGPGRGFVMVHAALDPESIRAALLRGDFYASSGVLLDRVQVENTTLHIDVADASPGTHTCKLIGTGGRVLAHDEGRSFRLGLGTVPPGYVRALVEDRQGRKAWIQPIRVPL